MPPQNAVRLARLLALRRLQSNAALSLEGYDRWGNDSEYAEREAHVALVAGVPETKREISALIATMRDEDPEALDYFICGQVRLLEDFLATLDDSRRTARHVAESELAGWQDMRTGGGLVDQNGYYVQQNAALFEEIFGFPPW